MNTTLRTIACICLVASLAFVGCSTVQPTSTAPVPPPVPVASVDNHPEVHVKNIEALNTVDDDFAANVSASGRFLFFTSTRSSGKGGQDLYVAVRSGDSWNSITPLATLNTSDNEGSSCISPDGQTLYFAAIDRSGGKGDADIYMSILRAGVWTDPVNVQAINSDAWESQPSISPDGNTLYFVSNRPGGVGGRDIWQSTRVNDTTWSAPENLGPTVNTPNEELSPSIAQDGSTMYFASNGHPSIGGYDVFVTRKKGSTWSKPQNLGTPVNSEANEMFYAAQIGTKNATFTSDRSGGKGGLDIYSAVPNPALPNPTTVVSGKVTDAKTHAPLGSKISITELKSGKHLSTFHSDDLTGEYSVVLKAGQSYAVTAEAPDHLFYSARFDVPVEMKDNRQEVEDIELQPVSGSVRLLVYFDFNKTDLTDESTAELQRLVSMMNDAPKMRVELDGHTDNKGTREYNDKLSADRAAAVKAWLVAHGIPTARVETKGYGMGQPVATNDTEDGRAKNRRVEFHILEE